ncbi:NO-inducible flavohemoprotein [Sphingomonas sp. KC8]|uniref:NO-inducible flavohemoprotein n=1 Tax=Sphingomonas sp. KC8 TaxID=1030157 RepID=UPI0002488605|nr:NO-inducible flavohemoprotein [Sphingomonas sp. KC8]ARS28923.1 dihydropteridine reductase [Sphingomonas sp. KC8]
MTAAALSDQTIHIVKATAPVIEVHGLDIVRRMYERMFENALIRDLFNQSHHGDGGSQPRALAAAILAYAQNIDQLAALAPAVERIAQKHVGLQIKPEHYPYVADALLGAIKDVLGDAATEDVLAAWGEAYWFLAHVLIGREKQIYHEVETAPGGWAGWRNFRIAAKHRESAIITSFTLEPEDGGPIMHHRPGQYLTFWLEIPGHPPIKRNYSISSEPGADHYRISVKQEAEGVASGWLHNQADVGTSLKVGAPAGEFFLADHPERPVVLLSGGVGLTPMISMLHTILARHPQTSVQYIHGTQDGSTHAMKQEVRDAVATSANASSAIFYLAPREQDRPGEDYDHAGLITAEWLEANTPVASADYFLCGPRAFLKAFVAGLSLAGVPASRIHYEFFGPADELLAA